MFLLVGFALSMFMLVEIFSVYPFLEVIFIMTRLRFGRPEGSPLQHTSSVGSGWGAGRLVIISFHRRFLFCSVFAYSFLIR